MGRRSKRYREAAAGIRREERYPLEEALKLAQERATAKFDEAIDVAITLGIDPRKTDQRVRGTVVLPHGTGRTPRVAVFARGEKAREAEEAGADVVGAEDLINRIDEGWSDFDVLAATPDMMSEVGRRLGRKLGPRMPNAKSGTLTVNIGEAVRGLKAGQVEYRNDNGGVVHAIVGRRSFTVEQLRENFGTLLGALVRAKPPTAKGTYLRRIFISSTQGPGIPVDLASAEAAIV